MTDDPTAEPHSSDPDPGGDAAPDEPGARRRVAPLTVATIVFGVGAVVMGVIALWLWTADDPASPVTVTGTISVVNEGYAGQSGGCTAELGTGQMTGTAVFVVDGEGAQLGTGVVGDGERAALFECRFDYTVSDVSPADTYTVVLGDTGVTGTATADELEADDYRIDLSVGGLSG